MDFEKIDRNLQKMQEMGASKEEMKLYLESATRQPESEPIADYGTARNLLQGGTSLMGWGDEAKARIGAGYAKTVGAITGEDMPSYDELVSEAERTQRANQEAFREESPVLAYGSEFVGDMLTGGGAIAGAKMLAPKAIGKAGALYAGLGAKGKRAAQLAGMGGTGAVSGGVYGAGSSEGTPQERFDAGLEMGLMGGGGGLALGAATPYVVKGGGHLFNKAKNLLSKPKRAVATATPTVTKVVPRTVDDIPTNVLSDDVNVLRVQEEARQGLLGADYQAQIQAADKSFIDSVRGATKGLASKDEYAETLLEGGISKVQKRFNAEKRLQGALMDARNKALASAKVYADYTKDTLGKGIKELKDTPDFKVTLGEEAMKPIRDKFKSINKILKNKNVSAINFSYLQSWRKGLNDFQEGTPQGVMAGKMGAVYDDWLSNITRQAIKEGDSEVVDKIFKANKSYANFKNTFGSNRYKGEAKVIEDIMKKEAITPDQLVNMVFGSGLGGKGTANQSVARLIKAMPEGARREGLRSDFKAGLIHKALGNSMNSVGEIGIGKLNKNLQLLLKNRAFTDNLASKADISAMKDIVTKTSQYMANQSRKDVYSPSGGAVLRGVNNIVEKLGLLTSVAGGRIVTEPVRAAVKEGIKAPDRRILEKSLGDYSQKLHKEIKLKQNIYGSAVGRVGIAKAGEE